MNDRTRVLRRPRRGRHRTTRTAAAIVGTTALALLAMACGGSKTGATSASSPSGAASNGPLSFSHCMRSNGIANYPDPDGSGAIPKETPQQLGISSSQYQAARNTCAHLLPSSNGSSQAEIQRAMSGMRDFARCMRSHGVSDWPDPTTDRAGYPAFYLRGKIDMNAPQITTNIHACQHLVPVTRVGGGPAGVPTCPGDRPGPGATSTCGGPNQGG